MKQPECRKMTDTVIRAIFEEANDFVGRTIKTGPWTLYAYAIDGLVSGGDISQYILKPITELLEAETMEQLYDRALHGTVYNAANEKAVIAALGEAADSVERMPPYVRKKGLHKRCSPLLYAARFVNAAAGYME